MEEKRVRAAFAAQLPASKKTSKNNEQN